MQILYDEEGDVLEVIFKEGAEHLAHAGYELHQGMVLYVTADMQPAQLTIVSYLPLSQLPAVHFERFKKHSLKIRRELLRLVAAPPVSLFLRIDPVTYYGQVIGHPVLEAFAKAA